MISISDFKDIILSKAGGKPVGKIPNFYSMVFEAMIDLKSKTDLPSAIRTVQLVNPIYSQIDMYALPNDISLGGIINVRPIIQDDTYYDLHRQGQAQFGIEKKFGVSNNYATKNINGKEYLSINQEVSSPTVLLSCDSLTDGITTASFGTTSDIELDTLQKNAGLSSIRFKANAGTENGIEVTYTTANDLSNKNDIILYVYLPVAVNGIGVRLGSNSLNYYTASTTQDFFGNALQVGWNLVRFNKTTFTMVGTANWSSITYFAPNIVNTFTATVENFRFDSVTVQNGMLYEIDYYSDYQFLTSTGVRVTKPSSDNDNIVLTDRELLLFLGNFLEVMATDLKQSGAVVDIQVYGGKKLEANVEKFKLDFPSQRQLPQTSYGYRPRLT